MELDLSNLVIIAAVAFPALLLLGLAPAHRLPSVVLELVAGIVIDPAALGWVEVVAGPATLEGEVDDFVDLATSRATSGTSSTVSPGPVDLERYSTVVIWCPRVLGALRARAASCLKGEMR